LVLSSSSSSLSSSSTHLLSPPASPSSSPSSALSPCAFFPRPRPRQYSPCASSTCAATRTRQRTRCRPRPPPRLLYLYCRQRPRHRPPSRPARSQPRAAASARSPFFTAPGGSTTRDTVALDGLMVRPFFCLSPDDGAIPGAPVLPTESMILSEGRMRSGWRHRPATNGRGRRDVRSNGVAVRCCGYRAVGVVDALVSFL